MKYTIMQNRVAPAVTVLFFIFLMGLSIFSVSYDARPFSGDAMTSGTIQLAGLIKHHSNTRLL